MAVYASAKPANAGKPVYDFNVDKIAGSVAQNFSKEQIVLARTLGLYLKGIQGDNVKIKGINPLIDIIYEQFSMLPAKYRAEVAERLGIKPLYEAVFPDTPGAKDFVKVGWNSGSNLAEKISGVINALGIYANNKAYETIDDVRFDSKTRPAIQHAFWASMGSQIDDNTYMRIAGALGGVLLSYTIQEAAKKGDEAFHKALNFISKSALLFFRPGIAAVYLAGDYEANQAETALRAGDTAKGINHLRAATDLKIIASTASVANAVTAESGELSLEQTVQSVKPAVYIVGGAVAYSAGKWVIKNIGTAKGKVGALSYVLIGTALACNLTPDGTPVYDPNASSTPAAGPQAIPNPHPGILQPANSVEPTLEVTLESPDANAPGTPGTLSPAEILEKLTNITEPVETLTPIADAVKIFIAYSGSDLATALSNATAPVNGIATVTWDANNGPMGLYICTSSADVDLTKLSLISPAANATPVPINEVVPVGDYTCAVTPNPFNVDYGGNVNVIGTPSAEDIANQQFAIVIKYVGPAGNQNNVPGGGGGSDDGGSDGGSSGGGSGGGGGCPAGTVDDGTGGCTVGGEH